MKLFVAFSYASMDEDDKRTYYGNKILEEPCVVGITSDHDLYLLQEQVLSTFGEPDKFRWVVINDYKWL